MFELALANFMKAARITFKLFHWIYRGIKALVRQKADAKDSQDQSSFE